MRLPPFPRSLFCTLEHPEAAPPPSFPADPDIYSRGACSADAATTVAGVAPLCLHTWQGRWGAVGMVGGKPAQQASNRLSPLISHVHNPSLPHLCDQAVQIAFADAARKAKPRGGGRPTLASLSGGQHEEGSNATRADALLPGGRMDTEHWPHEDDAFGTIMQWLYARIPATRGGRQATGAAS